MSGEPMSRGQRILALIIDWAIVIGLILGGFSFFGIAGGLNLFVIVALLAVIILIPVVYFKFQKWGFGVTLGQVIVIGLRRLYRRIRASESV